MCGIIGMAGTLDVKLEGMTKEFLTIDAIRGVDSVGICVVGRDDKVKIHKKAMLVQDFISLPSYSKCFHGCNKAVIGHNRFATLGGVDNINAHPFEFDKVVGVHNGTLRYRGLLPKAPFTNDSEHLYYAINEQGISKTWPQVEGAAALAFYSKEDKYINLIRNKERPLCYVFSKDRKAFFWASESWMLEGILGRNKVEHGDIIGLKPDTLYRFDLSAKGGNMPLDKVHIKELASYTPRVNTYRSNGYNNGYNNGGYKGNTYEVKKKPSGYLKSVPSSKKNLQTVKKFEIGSSIKITYTGGAVQKGLRTIKGFVTGDNTQEVLVYLRGSQLTNDLIKKGCVRFIGKVNGYSEKGSIIVQGNSITANTEKPAADREVIIDSQGLFMNRKALALIDSRAKDCVWCSSPIQFEDGNTFIDNSTTLCPTCTQDKQVTNYFSQI